MLDNTETMLRRVLKKIHISKRQIQKLIKDFNRDAGAGIREDTPVVASPYVFFGSEQCKEMQEYRPMLKELMRLLDSVPHYTKLNKENTLICMTMEKLDIKKSFRVEFSE